MRKLILTSLTALGVSCAASADLLIYAYNDQGEHRIHIKDLESGADQIVTPAGGAAWNATFSPDGTQIVYTWQKGDTSHVFVSDTDGSERRQLTEGNLVAFHPGFSPDGSKIVFTSWTDGGIGIMKADGTDRKLLAEHQERNFHPVFFQDGNRILFGSSRLRDENGDPGIFIYDLHSGQVHSTGYFGSYARPSHDGDWIVYSGKRSADADRDIMIGKLAGKAQPIPLTRGGGYDGHPAFTQDDQHIVFVSRLAQTEPLAEGQDPDTEGVNEVFMMNRDGSNIRRLTHGNAVSWHPEIFSVD